MCLERTRLPEKGKMSVEDKIYPVLPNFDAHQNRLGAVKTLSASVIPHYQFSQKVWAGEPGFSAFLKILR